MPCIHPFNQLVLPPTPRTQTHSPVFRYRPWLCFSILTCVGLVLSVKKKGYGFAWECGSSSAPGRSAVAVKTFTSSRLGYTSPPRKRGFQGWRTTPNMFIRYYTKRHMRASFTSPLSWGQPRLQHHRAADKFPRSAIPSSLTSAVRLIKLASALNALTRSCMRHPKPQKQYLYSGSNEGRVEREHGRIAHIRNLVSVRKLEVERDEVSCRDYGGAMGRGTFGWEAQKLRGEVKLDGRATDAGRTNSQNDRATASGRDGEQNHSGWARDDAADKSVGIFALDVFTSYSLRKRGTSVGRSLFREGEVRNILEIHKSVEGLEGFGEEGSRR